MRRTIWVVVLSVLVAPLCFTFAQAAGVATQAKGTPGSGVAAARRSAIQRAIKSIEAEAGAAAGGDWNRWFRDLAPFRAEMRATVAAGRARGGSFLLEAAGNPPLFDDPNDVLYLWEDGDLDSWLKQRTSIAGVIQASRWIQKQGVDVIFVPVPKMPEVYPDRLAQSVPADRIVAPQVRRLLLELLRADVEVVDLLPLFQAARRQSDEPLYLIDDAHWAPRAQAIAAEAIAERLRRYPLVRTALAQPPQFGETRITTPFIDGCWRSFLTPEQLSVARDYSWSGVQIVDREQRPITVGDESPVLLMGDSFVTMGLKPGMALEALVSRRINLAVARHTASGGTVEPIEDFAREPELLQNRKVVVWVVYNGSVSGAAKRWVLPGLPPPPDGKGAARLPPRLTPTPELPSPGHRSVPR